MPDLAAQIRADLDYRHGKLVDPDDPFAEIAFDGMRDAILGVLEWHQPMEIGDPDEPDHICGSCRYFTSEWPCPTVAEIADKLGIDGEA